MNCNDSNCPDRRSIQNSRTANGMAARPTVLRANPSYHHLTVSGDMYPALTVSKQPLIPSKTHTILKPPSNLCWFRYHELFPVLPPNAAMSRREYRRAFDHTTTTRLQHQNKEVTQGYLKRIKVFDLRIKAVIRTNPDALVITYSSLARISIPRCQSHLAYNWRDSLRHHISSARSTPMFSSQKTQVERSIIREQVPSA